MDEQLGAVLILTAFSQRDLVQRAAEAGAMGYLVKPFQKSDLMPAIDIALARHAQLSAVRGESADLSRATGDPQGRRQGQGTADGRPGHVRGRRLPPHPETSHERAPLDAGDRRRDRRARPSSSPN